MQGPATVVNGRVEGSAERAGAEVWHQTPKLSTMAWDGVGGGHLALIWVVWGFRDVLQW